MKLEPFVARIALMIGGTGAEAPNEYEVALAVQDAAVKFMEDTEVFRDELILTAQEGVTEYVLEMPECRRLVSPDLTRLLVNDTPVEAWRDNHEDVLVFADAPPSGACIVLPYSWKVARSECELPDKLYEDYLEPIRDYSLWILHSIFNSPFVGARRAEEAYARYHARVADVKANAVYGFARSRPRMRNPYRRRYRY